MTVFWRYSGFVVFMIGVIGMYDSPSHLLYHSWFVALALLGAVMMSKANQKP